MSRYSDIFPGNWSHKQYNKENRQNVFTKFNKDTFVHNNLHSKTVNTDNIRNGKSCSGYGGTVANDYSRIIGESGAREKGNLSDRHVNSIGHLSDKHVNHIAHLHDKVDANTSAVEKHTEREPKRTRYVKLSNKSKTRYGPHIQATDGLTNPIANPNDRSTHSYTPSMCASSNSPLSKIDMIDDNPINLSRSSEFSTMTHFPHENDTNTDATCVEFIADEKLNKDENTINDREGKDRRPSVNIGKDVYKKMIHDSQRRVLIGWMGEKMKFNGGHSLETSEDFSDGDTRRSNTSSQGGLGPPPLPPRRQHHDVSISLKQPQRQSSNNHRSLSESLDDYQMVYNRSPSLRKRDAMQRRYNSTSALFVPSEVTQLETNMINPNMYADIKLSHISASNLRESCDGNSDCGNGECDCKQMGREPTWLEFKHGNHERSMGLVDIVGESFEARYPWQRDVSTQCDLIGLTSRNSLSSCSRTSSESIDSFGIHQSLNGSHQYQPQNVPHSEDHMKKKQHAFKKARPNSVGSLDCDYQTESLQMREQHNAGRRGRLSEPNLQTSVSRRRMPLPMTDDPGSVSDLESILENPREGSSSTSRNSSLESAALADELSCWLKNINQNDEYLDVLASPRVSPEMWSNVPDVVVNTDMEYSKNDPENRLRSSSEGGMKYLSVPVKPTRRRSSGSITSGSEESDNEPSPPVARRGRRAAIVDTKNFGDVSPTTLSPDVSPSNSCDEGDGASNIAGRLRRRRSSVDLAMNVYPGDLLVQEHHKKLIKRNTISDFYASRNGSTPSLNDETKKQRQSFSLLKLMKTRSKESLLHLGDVIQQLKPSEFKDNHLAAYKTIHWTDLIASTDKQTSVHETLNISEVERKRRESVWEMFRSECVFLIDHLMVLKHCFLEPLKKVQVEGFLMYAEPSEIFSNLDELCYVSYTFCKDFIASLVKDMSATDFGRTSVLIKAFQRFSTHSKDGSVYHTYCLNYSNALTYLEKLRKNDNFCEFEKWCEQDQRCNRLQLVDLLIGPMQHCTKLPLLLQNIKKYTETPVEKKQISESIEKVELSLQQLEDKMKWLKNFERVQEIQRHLVWPAVTDLDTRAFIPEYLKPKLLRQPCERLLACPSRQLLHEGAITLTESTKSFDAYLFLFDDILLITKIKKPNRKKQSSGDLGHQTPGQADKQIYTVHRQPLALDRLGIHDVNSQEAAANGIKFAFVIVQISRFQQIIDVFTLQSSSELLKNTWITNIREAKNRYCNRCVARDNSKDIDDPEPNNNRGESQDRIHSSRRLSGGKKIQHGKSLSVDAVFL